MGRKRNDSEIEQLEKEIKELKSINRSLERQIKKLNSEYKYEASEKEETTYKVYTEERDPCANCGKGDLETVELAGRTFKRCGTCDYRSKAQKKG